MMRWAEVVAAWFVLLGCGACGGGQPEAQSPSQPAAERRAQPAVNGEAETSAERVEGPAAADGDRAEQQPEDDASSAPMLRPPAKKESRARGDSAEIDVLSAAEALANAEDAFARAVASSQPDCETARGFRDAVCSLAERICQLVDDAPSSLVSRCDDGRQRCEQSKRRYARHCE